MKSENDIEEEKIVDKAALDLRLIRSLEQNEGWRNFFIPEMSKRLEAKAEIVLTSELDLDELLVAKTQYQELLAITKFVSEQKALCENTLGNQ